EEQVEREDSEEARESELLREARDDEVALRERHQVGAALAEASADETAIGNAEEALHELPAAADRVVDLLVEGVEPATEPAADIAEQLAGEHCATDEEPEPHEDPARPARRDIDHDEEEAEVEERGAEVALEDEHRHRGRPDDEDRAEVACPRKPHAEDLLADH